MKKENDVQGMTEIIRCPACHLAPKVSVNSDDFSVTFQCERHGHMAVGASLDVARANWNQYISFVAKAA